MSNCSECGRYLKPIQRSNCPSCKICFCFKCFGKHLRKKICAYGKADKIDVEELRDVFLVTVIKGEKQ